MRSLSDEIKISSAVTPTAGGSAATDLNGSIIDMKGWEGVLVIVRMGAINDSAVVTVKAQQGAASNLSDAADIEGSEQSVAGTADEKSFFIDVPHVAERYFRLVVTRGTAVATVSSAHYIQYNGRNVPVSSHGTNVSGEKCCPVKEGTA